MAPMTGVLEWKDSQGRRGGGVTPYVNDQLECMELMTSLVNLNLDPGSPLRKLKVPVAVRTPGKYEASQDSQVIRPIQHGFMNSRCCLPTLFSFFDKVTPLVDEGKAVDVVYLEFRKAFDTISHSILLEKLAAHGLDRCTLCWVKNWLDGQAQRVVGSVLGPVLFNIIINDLDEGIECTCSKFADDTSWAGALISLRVGRLYRGIWTGWIDGPRPIRWVLHLGHNNPMQLYRLGGEWLESCLAEKDLGLLVDIRLNMSQQCVQEILWSEGLGKRLSPLNSGLVRLYLKCRVQVWAPHFRKDIEVLDHVQRRATKLVKGLEHKADEEQLRELGLFSVEKRRLRGELTSPYNYLKGGCSDGVTSDRRRGTGLRLFQGRFRLDIRKDFFTERGIKHWNRLPREVVESPSLEVFKRHVELAPRRPQGGDGGNAMMRSHVLQDLMGQQEAQGCDKVVNNPKHEGRLGPEQLSSDPEEKGLAFQGMPYEPVLSSLSHAQNRAALGGAWPPRQESYHHPPRLSTGVATSGIVCLGVGLLSLEE
ncbi:hypothetical protein QYF61_023719 [Mycteria americana]|uniref:Reverse transcriptase domain-containing protein n=1 Tax=Mycteria americana TaxID=33587 RepID=A0AAN7RS13_MYCAM|nr:hypothetical protein QYF61_023719 [Mycteria americana]